MCGDSADAPGQPPPLRSAFAPADRLAPPKPAIPPRDDAPPFRHPFDSVPNLSPCFRHALVTPLCHAAGRRAGFRPENGHGTAFWHEKTGSGSPRGGRSRQKARSRVSDARPRRPIRARTRLRGHFPVFFAHGTRSAAKRCAKTQNPTRRTPAAPTRRTAYADLALAVKPPSRGKSYPPTNLRPLTDSSGRHTSPSQQGKEQEDNKREERRRGKEGEGGPVGRDQLASQEMGKRFFFGHEPAFPRKGSISSPLNRKLPAFPDGGVASGGGGRHHRRSKSRTCNRRAKEPP